MKSLRFYKTDDGFYELEETENLDLLVLAFFLLHDATENEELYINWIDSIEEEYEDGTLTYITKNPDGRSVTINCIVDEDDEFEPLTLSVSTENFMQLLADWQNISSDEPDTITISQDNGTFSLK